MGETPIDCFYAALGQGDIAAARICFTPDATLWHNYDAKRLSVDEAVVGWEQVNAAASGSGISDVTRIQTADGFVQRHVWTMTTRGGKRMSWAICIFVRIEGDRIARLDEYIDRAGTFESGSDPVTTPGMV